MSVDVVVGAVMSVDVVVVDMVIGAVITLFVDVDHFQRASHE
jgi:hypothetical protein